MTERALSIHAPWHMVHRAPFELAEQANARRSEFTDQPRYFDARTVEFLMLLHRLRKIEGFDPRRILEVGCGSAYSLRPWAPWVEAATGVDLPDAIERARAMHAVFPPPAKNVEFVPSRCETMEGVKGRFDLVVTQYVLEHVDDIASTLSNVRDLVRDDGIVVHALPNLEDRVSWYQEYRMQRSWPRRIYDSLRARGFLATLYAPFHFTPPHEPRLWTFEEEFAACRVEVWALHVMRAGFEIIDTIQIRDTTCILVTRKLPEESG